MNSEFVTTPQHADQAARRVTGPAAMPRGWVSHSLRQMERWIAWSIAVYTAWLAAFVYPDVPALWFSVLYAGLIGWWAEVHPARSHVVMATRGAALIAGAWGLHTQIVANVGGPGGAFFMWLGVPCLLYAFLLRPVWAAALVLLAIVELSVAAVLAGSGLMEGEFLAQIGFLCIFPLLLGMRFGAEFRRPDDLLEAGRIDPVTSLYNKSGLLAYGSQMLDECNVAGKPLAVVVFDCRDLVEVRSLYSTDIARKLMTRTVQKFVALASDRGLAARTGSTEFTVVLPGMNREKALAAVSRVLGHPCRIELDAGGDEVVVVPNFALDCSGPDVESIHELYREVQRTLVDAGAQELRRQTYLQRERERHSRPVGLRAIDGSMNSLAG
ncbi:MAG: diguanylate cyclase [Pseudomonadota bacterium]